MQVWLQSFQSKVDKLTNLHIQSTMNIWKPDEKSREIIKNKINMIGGSLLPYLDSQMYFDEKGNVCFKMYSKKGNTIKYVKRRSIHTTACLDAIPKGADIRA